MTFLAIMDFLEQASGVFSGFVFDINKTIVDRDFFSFMFDILEYYSYSDILLKKAFGLIKNILNTRLPIDQAREGVRYLLEDTKFLSFLIKNGPKCIL